MSTWETLIVTQDELDKGVYILTLNRPNSLNSLNTQMGLDLINCLTELQEKKDIRVLVVTSAGERAFCAGADLKERHNMTHDDWKRQHDIFEDAGHHLRDFDYPVIAAVNGYALAGGLEIALSCDIRIAADHAKLGLTEATVGLIPGLGGTQMLPRTIPVGLAKEMLFSGKHMTASRAKEIGLVNDVVPMEQLLEAALEMARGIAKNAPLSLKSIKKAVNNGMQTDLHTGLNIELAYYYTCANSEDRLEGVKAFNEKRRPHWQGK